MFLIFIIRVNLEKFDNFKIISFTSYQLLDLFAQGQETTLSSVTLLTFRRPNGCFSKLIGTCMLLQEPYSCL